MLTTFKLLSEIVTKEQSDMSLEDIATEYKRSLNPQLLGAAFQKCFYWAFKVSKRYAVLTSADKASLALEMLDKCLITYDSSKAGFLTFYTSYLVHAYNTEIKSLNYHKRKAVYNSESYEELLLDGYDAHVELTEIDDLLFVESLNSLGLTERELLYCKLIIQDMPNVEIAEELNVSVMTLCNMRKALKEKLKILVSPVYNLL